MEKTYKVIYASRPSNDIGQALDLFPYLLQQGLGLLILVLSKEPIGSRIEELRKIFLKDKI